MKLINVKNIFKTFIFLVVGIFIIFSCSRIYNAKNKITVNNSIAGFWEGMEQGSDGDKIVFQIVKKDSQAYTGTGYGFMNGIYVEHWNLDSVSFNTSTNELYTYCELHDCIYKGTVDFHKQSISGTIQSWDENSEMVMKRIEEKALKGLHPRGSIENEIVPYEYKLPEQLNDGLETSTLEKEGVNSQLVIEAINKIIKKEFVKMTSLLIMKNNKLVCEAYFHGFDITSLNRLASCSKSVTSLLFGIAIDNGKINGVDESAISYFPEYNSLKTEENAKILTKHLLTMSAGFEWDEFAFPFGDPQNILTQNNDSDDYLKHIFKRPMVDTPGEKFNYSCACTILLGWILKNTTGMHADKYAEQHLFNHLGIDNYFWVKRRDGFPCVHGGLFLTARDMAKIGMLVLNEGKWQGKQIVSKNWIHESTREHIKANDQHMGYGYQWWNVQYPVNGKTLYTILAIGADPQKIIIIPELRAIIVTTGTFTFIEEKKSPVRMIKKYIAPALL